MGEAEGCTGSVMAEMLPLQAPPAWGLSAAWGAVSVRDMLPIHSCSLCAGRELQEPDQMSMHRERGGH